MRERILGRIREASAALPRAARPEIPRPGEAGDLVDLLVRRIADVKGESVVLEAGEVDGWLRAFAAGFPTVCVGQGVPEGLRPALPSAPPESAALGVSVARWAIAETGSVVLDAREGRRSQLLPPVHLVWVPAERILGSWVEALERLSGEDLPSAVGIHTGPSRSADIGRVLLYGVHGPGRTVTAVVRATR